MNPSMEPGTSSDSETASKLVLPRKKCTKILTDMLGKVETIKSSGILSVSKFSVMIGESTTIANKKLLCVLVKVMKSDREIVTQCFDMIKLDRADCSASAIFIAFESVFEKQNIPLYNIICLHQIMQP